MEDKTKSERPFISKRMKNGLKFVAVLLTLILGIFCAGRLAVMMLPFTIAVIIAQLLEPLIRFCMRTIHAKRKVIASIITILFYAVFFVLLTVGVSQIVREITELLRDIPSYAFGVTQWLEQTFAMLQENLKELPDNPDLINTLNSLLNSLFQALSSATQSLVQTIVSGVTHIPQLVIYLFMTIVSTVLITSQRDIILAFAKRQLPQKWLEGGMHMRDSLAGALLGYIKAQAKLMCIVALELFIGFSVLKHEYAFILAIIIAILDALPFIGAGLILIPYSIISFIIGDVYMGIGVGCLYFITLALRQSLEPRVLSGEIGLHPLVTLGSMLLGYNIIGVFGMILGPVFALIVINFMQIHLKGRTLQEMLDGAEAKTRKDKPEPEKKNRGFGFFKSKKDKNTNDEAKNDETKSD